MSGPVGAVCVNTVRRSQPATSATVRGWIPTAHDTRSTLSSCHRARGRQGDVPLAQQPTVSRSIRADTNAVPVMQKRENIGMFQALHAF